MRSRPLLSALIVLPLLLAPVRAADEEPLATLWFVHPTDGWSCTAPELLGDDFVIAATEKKEREVYRIDAATGRVKWKATLPAQGYGGVAATPTVVLAEAETKLYGLEAADGSIRYAIEFPKPVGGAPAVEGEHVLAASGQGHVGLFALADGREIWRREFGWWFDGLALAGDYAIAPTQGGKDAGLHVLSRATGKTLWSRDLPGKAAAVAGDTIWFGDAAMRLSDGSVRWVIDRPATEWVAAGDRVIGCFGGVAVAAHDARTGERLWRRLVPGKIEVGSLPLRSGVAVGGGLVAVAAETGGVMLLDLADGRIVARREFDLKIHDDNGLFPVPPAIRGGRMILPTGGGQTLCLAFPGAPAEWAGERGGGARLSRAAGATAPEAVPTIPEDQLPARRLARATAVKEPNARVDALARFLRRFAGTPEAAKARATLREIYETRLRELSLAGMPAGSWALDFPDLDAEIDAYLASPPFSLTCEDLGVDADPAIVFALRSHFVGSRAWACRALAELRSPAGFRQLVRLATKDASDLVRAAAVEQIGRFGDQAATRRVHAFVARDPAEAVRRAACVIAPKVLGPDAPDFLRRHRDEDPEGLVRQLAGEILADLE